MRGPEVRFSLDDREQKASIEEYARGRGFKNIGSLARFALFQYMSRYPDKRGSGSTAQRSGRENREPLSQKESRQW